MDKTKFADAIRSIGTQFTKLSVVEDIDSHGYMTEVETPAGTFYASMQGHKDLTESVTAAGTIYTGKSYFYVAESEIALAEGDRFSDSEGLVWVAKSIIDDYRKVAGYSKWIVERVIL